MPGPGNICYENGASTFMGGGGRAPLLELPTVDLTFVVFDYLKVQAWQAVIESF